eukprot:Skav219129  [mRNA]  locus=scaffold1574:544820:549024:+ [translate_table: standard]
MPVMEIAEGLTCTHDSDAFLLMGGGSHHQAIAAKVKYLYGDVQKAGGDAVRFYADDVVYEDMNYETPFVGKTAVEGFLKRIVRFLKQLYLLAYGFIEGTMAVLWVTILASFMLYICAVILVRAYGKNGHSTTPDADRPTCRINGLLVALINESILEKNQARIEADRMDRETKRKAMQQRCGELFDELDVHLDSAGATGGRDRGTGGRGEDGDG